ncbi:sirohydrochlorin chelatase [Thiocystis violacea]|uniref:sirohydrochlorin chelatase n=1 Tax=Thiocystis violacea TaxID=13725 RepID=UPI0019035B36|nr:CbiX/SirB N-terminal domain-containing protein [Thiocystis violacea]MBK1720673.1 cobalamin biosynthesis protein CbiX [Thiocystis violacea]
MRTLLLVDNGSKRPESTLNLRRLAEEVSARLGETLHPISLLHSDQIPSDRLEGRSAETFAPALRRLIAQGCRDLVLVPLFFGPSRALTQYVPETAAEVAAELGRFELQIAPELCPLPAGEPRLADILIDQVQQTALANALKAQRVVLVDHGSPIPQVTAVRRWLAEQLGQRLGSGVALEQAVMERRPGPDYDFNGPLLEDLLIALAEADARTPVLLSMLFLSAGRHAGAGGDIADICERVMAAHPGFRILTSPLVGDHPGLVEILAARMAEARRWSTLSLTDT